MHVIHISGKQMKACGVDGLSRGDLLEGMMTGSNPLAFVPLNEGANERAAGQVENWVRSWWKDRSGNDWAGVPLIRIGKDQMCELRDI